MTDEDDQDAVIKYDQWRRSVRAVDEVRWGEVGWGDVAMHS